MTNNFIWNTVLRRLQLQGDARGPTRTPRSRMATPASARSLTKRVLIKVLLAFWRSGLVLAALIVALVLMAILNLGTHLLAWTAIEPTDDYVTNRWLSLVFPAITGLVVGISIAWRNWKGYRVQTLNGLGNLVRSTAGGLATCTEVYMGIAAIRWTINSSVEAAKSGIPEGATPETIQPYIEVSLAETFLLCVGIYATVEITRRACWMRNASARTARAQFRADFWRSVEGLKTTLSGEHAAVMLRQKSYRRAQARVNSVWSSQEFPGRRRRTKCVLCCPLQRSWAARRWLLPLPLRCPRAECPRPRTGARH